MKRAVKRGITVAALALGVLLVVAWPDVLAFMHGARPENKNRIYALRQALMPGMHTTNVVEVVERFGAPHKRTWLSPDRLVVSTPVGFLEDVTVELEFSQGRLVHARVRDDRGHVPPDAPKDF